MRSSVTLTNNVVPLPFFYFFQYCLVLIWIFWTTNGNLHSEPETFYRWAATVAKRELFFSSLSSLSAERRPSVFFSSVLQGAQRHFVPAAPSLYSEGLAAGRRAAPSWKGSGLGGWVGPRSSRIVNSRSHTPLPLRCQWDVPSWDSRCFSCLVQLALLSAAFIWNAKRCATGGSVSPRIKELLWFVPSLFCLSLSLSVYVWVQAHS